MERTMMRNNCFKNIRFYFVVFGSRTFFNFLKLGFTPCKAEEPL